MEQFYISENLENKIKFTFEYHYIQHLFSGSVCFDKYPTDTVSSCHYQKQIEMYVL